MHALAEEKEEETKYIYYEKLEETIEDIKITLGDANVKFSKEHAPSEFTRRATKHNISIENVSRLIALVIEQKI